MKETLSQDDQTPYASSIISVPLEIGLTGKAIQDRQILHSDKGSYDPRFRFEADKVGDVPYVDNTLIVPIFFDKKEKSEVMGALQLYNLKT